MPVALIVDPEVHKRIRKAVQRARKRIRSAQPYMGPRGGQWEDPAHTQHWRGAQHPGPHASPAAALDLSEVDLNTDGVDDAEVPHLLHVVGIDQDDLALHNGRMVDVMVQRDAGTGETAIHVTLPRSSWEDRSKTWERPLALRITLNPDRTAYVESVHTHPPGTGYGARLASRMIARLRAAGYTRIDLIAVRAEPDEDDPVGMNGYYTWPRFGWEARLDPRVMTAPLPRLPAALAGARTLSDLMKTEEGRDWWREHGQSIPATFDLAPDSVSSRLHAKYLEEKGIALAKGGGLDTSAADEAALDRAWERLRLEDARGMAKAERHTTYQGLPIHIEHDRGDTRRGTSPDGTEWATTMSHPYGEVTGTLAIDGDPIDVFLGPNPHATHAYVVQSKLPGTSKLDECKVMLGWDTQEEAVAAFRRNYDRPGFFLDVTKWPMPAFIDLVHHHRDLQDGKLDAAALAKVQRRALAKGRKDTLPGGKGDDLEVRDVDHEEFEAGLREEMEEHGTNRSVATEIVLDHLAENPRYYSEMRRTKTRARKRLAKARARIRKVIALWKARGKKLKPGERVTRADGAVWVGQLVGPPKRISKRRGRGQVWRTTYGDHVVEDDDHGVQVIHAPTGRVIHQGLNQAHAHDIAQAADRDATPKPKVPAAGHIYDRIWANYLALTRKLRMSGGVDYPGGFVDIADVQDAMSREGFSASEVEDALVHMNDARMVQLLPNENLKTLTERDHHAAIRLGERDRHLLMMEAAPDANRLRQTPRPDWRWKPLPASASAEAHVRHAYHRAAPFPNALVRTSEIRKFIPAEVPQAEIDAALRRLRYSGAALFDGDVMSLLKAADTFTLPEHPEARAALAVAMEKAYQHRAKPPKNPDGWEPPGGTHPKTWRKGTPDRKGKATSTAGEFKRAAARELVNALDRVTHPEARKQLERAFVGLGLEKLHERGERVTYDGRRHASPEELFPGDAAHVVHPGWAVTDDAGPVLIRKAEVRPHKTAAFHEQVVHAASQLRTPIGTSGRHFSERVAIAQVYDKMHADGTFAGSLDAFKRQLVEAAGARKLRLERLDLREGLANDLRERSHTRWGSDSVHFVWLPDEEAERRRQAERATGRS